VGCPQTAACVAVEELVKLQIVAEVLIVL
jgi:hypothetical protein